MGDFLEYVFLGDDILIHGNINGALFEKRYTGEEAERIKRVVWDANERGQRELQAAVKQHTMAGVE